MESAGELGSLPIELAVAALQTKLLVTGECRDVRQFARRRQSKSLRRKCPVAVDHRWRDSIEVAVGAEDQLTAALVAGERVQRRERPVRRHAEEDAAGAGAGRAVEIAIRMLYEGIGAGRERMQRR